MSARITAVIALALGLLIAGIAQEWRYDAKLAGLASAHAKELKEISDEAAKQRGEALTEQQALQQQAQTRDQQHTQELANEQSENERLRRLYSGASSDADGLRKRLRVQAKCPAATGGNVPETAGTGRVGDAAGVELSDAAGQDVFDIRRGIVSDQRKLAYLQDYARICAAMGVTPPLP